MISLSANTNDSRFQGKEASLCIILADIPAVPAPGGIAPGVIDPEALAPWDIIPMDTARRPRRP